MNELIKTSQNQTMSLKDITDMLDVRHNDAMKVVEKMSENQEFGNVTKIPYRTSKGNEYETYALDKRQSLAVSAKLNTVLLMRVIDRWQELENIAKPKELTRMELIQLAYHSELALQQANAKIDHLTKQTDTLEDKLFDDREELLILQTMVYQGTVH